MAISAALVKELRDRTGAGMMECKKALQETGGDVEAAIEVMRKAGLAKADKKAGRIAAEGLIVVSQSGQAAAMAEVNCETDFVAKRPEFQDFATALVNEALSQDPPNLEGLLMLPLEGDKSVDEVRREMIAKIGENISVRRFVRMDSERGLLNSYLHGGRIGVIVELEGGDETLAKDIAMHVAASKPICVSADQVPPALLAKEREIYAAQAETSGKPANIIEKMVDGRLRKYVSAVTLLGQPFVKDPDRSVEKVLKAHNAKVIRFERFELGEGIEKKAESFADEVMAQVRGG